MPDLSTTYMNIPLRNPLIVSSSGLTNSAAAVRDAAAAGAGAVVLKSLFEEELAQDDSGVQENVLDHAEAYEYYYAKVQLLYGARTYTDLIKECKATVDIPVIASLNCVTGEWWKDFASQIEGAGADGIELNVFTLPTDTARTPEEIESVYFSALRSVKMQVNIPVSLKISPYFTSLPRFCAELGYRDLDGLVLFNRFAQPDIDIDDLKLQSTFSFSSNDEMSLPLKWIAVMSHYLNYDLCASTGVKDYQDVVKLLLAGAQAVQMASVVYQNGLGVLEDMRIGLERWMEEHKFESIEDFRGKLNFHKAGDAFHYLRSQFMVHTRNS